MRFSTMFLVVSLAAVLGLYWYSATAAECPVPLHYRLGEIDESFTISRDEALARIAAAEKVWEDEFDRDLFVYDEASDFTIDFVFDERQQTINTEAVERQELDVRQAKNEEIVALVESTQAEYADLRQRYETRVAAYEAELDAYNSKVRTYNDRGGAPADVFDELETDRVRLAAEADALTAMTTKLNELASQISELSERGNEQIEAYNRDVTRYNNRYGYTREFTQGDYQGDAIHIYTFTSDEELETVLAHEFGHALGIDHVEGTSSLMYYLMDDPHRGPVLSAEDQTAFLTTCGSTETLGQRIRAQIRVLLDRF